MTQQWKPIESAPKDGTGILGYWNDGRLHDCNFRAVKFHRGAWWETNEDYKVRQPTHWMPLPAAPGTPPSSAQDDAKDEKFIQAAVDHATEPLRRLGEYLSRVLDEDQWAIAESMILGARNNAPTNERSMYEAWERTRAGYPFARQFANLMWEAWQARASVAAPAAGDARMLEFVREVAQQKPEKPDYWSSCGQCASNISQASDLLDGIAASQQQGG
ncbi:hypothetical protein LMG26685_02925 [Achromobacter mucicolens]|uniref:DUF551 domain-containing protein n=1 Tax=Achromobacter mucicolens TaxID=1389922 RepID=UPI0009D52FCB|nr:DUF551 domain-containing protein [Achromobacter mucicolens]OXC91000.1 hypothetical protein BMR85_007310 [Achromobacter sp. KAs 3-5]CAB3654448.1 hypothetical protein LMG26685_02925 [Achromobacter mucicolens]